LDGGHRWAAVRLGGDETGAVVPVTTDRLPGRLAGRQVAADGRHVDLFEPDEDAVGARGIDQDVVVVPSLHTWAGQRGAEHLLRGPRVGGRVFERVVAALQRPDEAVV